MIAESFERIHRSNLVGMGVLPLQFLPGRDSRIAGIDRLRKVLDRQASPQAVATGARARVWAKSDADEKTFEVIVRIDTPQEAEYYRNGGILPYVVRQLASEPRT